MIVLQLLAAFSNNISDNRISLCQYVHFSIDQRTEMMAAIIFNYAVSCKMTTEEAVLFTSPV